MIDEEGLHARNSIHRFAHKAASSASNEPVAIGRLTDALEKACEPVYSLTEGWVREHPAARPRVTPGSRPELRDILASIGSDGAPGDLSSVRLTHIKVDLSKLFPAIATAVVEYGTAGTPFTLVCTLLTKAWEARHEASRPLDKTAGLVLWAAWQDRDLDDDTIAAKQIPEAVKRYCTDFDLEQPDPRAVRRAIAELEEMRCLAKSRSAPSRFEIERFIKVEWR